MNTFRQPVRGAEGRVMTMSLVLTEHFGRRHKHVPRGISEPFQQVPQADHRLNFEAMIHDPWRDKGTATLLNFEECCRINGLADSPLRSEMATKRRLTAKNVKETQA